MPGICLTILLYRLSTFLLTSSARNTGDSVKHDNALQQTTKPTSVAGKVGVAQSGVVEGFADNATIA